METREQLSPNLIYELEEVRKCLSSCDDARSPF
jgi:hypothetical protein